MRKVGLLLLLGLAVGCSGGSGRGEESGAEVAAGGVPASVLPPAGPAPGPYTSELDIFPATAARGLVINRCSTCHAVACTAIRARSLARWTEIEREHEGAVPGLSKEDSGKIFEYLRRNFSDTVPEAIVPQEFVKDCPGGTGPGPNFYE